MTALVLMGGLALLMLLGVRGETKRLKVSLAKKLPQTQALPKAIGMLLIVAQISELLKMVEHATIVHVATALLLLAIATATRSGPERV